MPTYNEINWDQLARKYDCSDKHGFFQKMLIDNNYSLKELHHITGLSSTTLSKHAKLVKVASRRKGRPPIDWNSLVQATGFSSRRDMLYYYYWEKYLTAFEVGATLGVAHNPVINALREDGIKIRKPGWTESKKKNLNQIISN